MHSVYSFINGLKYMNMCSIGNQFVIAKRPACNIKQHHHYNNTYRIQGHYITTLTSYIL